jgi:Ca2+-binding RTX toxin-like protein
MNGANGNDRLESRDGNDHIFGGSGQDTLIGGRGNDGLEGGNGDDMFVFSGTFGHDTVDDFHHGDLIKFEGEVFQDLEAVRMASHQVGGDTVITLDDGNSIVLGHVALSSLHASDFWFV